MCSRTAVLAAMLAITPVSGQAADLVIWWEEGQYAEENQSGHGRSLRRSSRTVASRLSSSLVRKNNFGPTLARRSRPGSEPPTSSSR